jgi:hypothetical protein
MKHLFFLLLITIIGISCQKDTTEIGFPMTYRSTFESQAGLIPFARHYFLLKDIQTDTIRYFQQNGITSNKLRGIRLEVARMDAFASAYGYRHIKEVSLWIVNQKTGAKTEIAYRDQFTITTTLNNTLDLLPTQVNIKDYFLSKQFTLELRVEVVTTSPELLDNQIEVRFKAFQ